jgi:alpha-beta hydrolase superfamily lysophospholipase
MEACFLPLTRKHATRYCKAMRVTRKRLAVSCATLLLLAVAGLNGLAWSQSHAMLHYADGGTRTLKPEALTPLQKALILITGTRVPRPHSTRTPADYQLPFERLHFPASPEIELGAWYCPVPTDSPLLVILFHGYAQDKASLLPEAAALHSLGIPSLLVDFRGSGDSSASHATIGFEESEDVAAACRYARSHYPRSRLVLYGQSMGAAAILRAIARCDVKPDAIVLEAVFDTLLQTVENRFHAMKVPAFPNAHLMVLWGGWQFGFNGFALRPVDDARAVRCPALFFHGSGDPRARPEEAERVRLAIPGRTSRILYPSAGHDDTAVASPDLWRRSLRTFFEDAFERHAP